MMYKLYWPGRDFLVHETGTIEEMKEYLDASFERDVGPVTVGVGSPRRSDYYAWVIVDDHMRMELWQRTENYMGPNFYEYFVFLGKHRDSGPIDVSNFQVALNRLGGESDTVLVVRNNHWLVGWTEQILIHQGDWDKVYRANDMLVEIEDYPVLDDEDHAQTKIDMEWEEEEGY